jgi:RNA-directed DNA polymerase
MIKTDLHNFFPAVSERSVYRVFRSLGYAPLVSFEMARICTWPRPNEIGQSVPEAIASSDRGGYPYSSGTEGALPQGAPTSGALANAATRKLDETLTAFALNARLVYTRYSDDMAFSSSEPFDRPRAASLISELRRIVTASGFEIHQQKTKIIPPGARKMLLGMMITDDGVAILPEHRRRIDLYIHCVERFGPTQFAKTRKFDSAISFINHVEGWLAYLSHIDPVWTKIHSVKWSAALASHQVFSRVLD